MVSIQDMDKLPGILHENAVFRSPMAFKPYVSAAVVRLILNTVSKVFTQFEYHRQLVSEDGLSVRIDDRAGGCYLGIPCQRLVEG
jgi:hypothetical protein